MAKTDIRAAAIIQKYYIRPAEEFYDIQSDPREQINLIYSEDHQEQINRMRVLLDDWMSQQGESKDIFETPYPITGLKPHEIFKN
jgi:hypothetical protein